MDNYFKNCPAIMSDGRYFTDWKSASRRNEYIKYINDITRDDDYRMLLQCNANKFMDKEWDYFSKKMKCSEKECVHNYQTRVLPQTFRKELQDFNNSMDPRKPKLKNTCQKMEDFRLTVRNMGMKCAGRENDTIQTEEFNAEELINNKKVYDDYKYKLMSNTIPVGMEETPKYAPIVEELFKPRSEQVYTAEDKPIRQEIQSDSDSASDSENENEMESDMENSEDSSDE